MYMLRQTLNQPWKEVLNGCRKQNVNNTKLIMDIHISGRKLLLVDQKGAGYIYLVLLLTYIGIMQATLQLLI